MFDREGEKIKKIKETRGGNTFMKTFKDRSSLQLGHGALYGFQK